MFGIPKVFHSHISDSSLDTDGIHALPFEVRNDFDEDAFAVLGILEDEEEDEVCSCPRPGPHRCFPEAPPLPKVE